MNKNISIIIDDTKFKVIVSSYEVQVMSVCRKTP